YPRNSCNSIGELSPLSVSIRIVSLLGGRSKDAASCLAGRLGTRHHVAFASAAGYLLPRSSVNSSQTRKIRSNNRESEAQVMRVMGIAACGNFNCQREIVGRSRSFALAAVRLTVRSIEVRSIKYGSWTF